MQKILGIIVWLASSLAVPGAHAAENQSGAPNVRASLITDKTAVRPGATITVALRQNIADGWHTYWVNPGDVGEATAVTWSLPAGASAGALRWPLPHVIKIGPLIDYGYSGEVLLLADITLPQTLEGTANIVAAAKWLVCKEICVPEEATVRLSLPVLEAGLSPRPSPHAALIETARAEMPVKAPWPARFEAGKSGLTLVAEGFSQQPGSTIRFFPLQPDVISNTAPQNASFEGGNLILRLQRAEGGPAALPAMVEGVLVLETPDGRRRGFQVSGAAAASTREEAAGGQGIPNGAAKTVGGTPGPALSGSGGGQPDLSLGLALVFAFLGGLILNLMPCIFPVLSLKALSLAGEKAITERHMHGYAYLAGVLASCIAVGIVLVAVRASGAAIGWGMQFHSPAFVLVMMALFLGLGLHMSGVFTFGAGRLANAGDRLTHTPGLTGYFFTGVLATAVATPCTAPFMGAAVSYAFVQPAIQLFAVLLALGLGFALPMLLLSLSPALGQLLPKPGAWMQTFKELMAFPLYATVGWLMWVLAQQQGSGGVLAGVIALVGVAFAAWLCGAAHEPGGLRARIAAVVAFVAVAAGVAWLPQGPDMAGATAGANGQGPQFQAFSTARLNALRAEGKPVFVNMTAAWCITCLVNERMALKSDRIAGAFTGRGITYLKGDWTNGDPEITAFLKNFGRAGVPLYVYYPARGEPVVLPQFLTESIVLDGIASGKPQRQAGGGKLP